MSRYLKYNSALKQFSCEAAYILNKKVFNNEYFKLLDAFKSKYAKTNIAYSFKTNYVPDLVNEVKKNKGYAEVVSSMELKLARKIGLKIIIFLMVLLSMKILLKIFFLKEAQ